MGRGAAGGVELRAGDVRLTVDPQAGGRMSSLRIGATEVLVTEGWGPIRWGCYPMAPFAGRIRDGRFTFRGREVQVPLNLSPDAIHGTVFDRPWDVVSRADDRLVLAIDLGSAWPFRGTVTQSIGLAPGGLDATLTLEAEEAMPAVLGWHPWFRRYLDHTPSGPGTRSAEVEIIVDATAMFERGTDGLPTGALVVPRPRPWDDAFTGLRSAPIVRWPDALEITLSSTAGVWVVYDEPVEGVCVEPQTAPPDAANLAAAAGEEPDVADAGRPMTASMAWSWRSPRERRPPVGSRPACRRR
jgi:aldose 1-epimerase